MSKISQIQVSYIQEEDRLLLRLNTSTQDEFRFWLTRRYTDAIWPLLQRALYEAPSIKQQQPHNKNAVINFERKAAVESIDLEEEFQKEVKSYPLGKKPVLLSQAKLKSSKENTHTLSLKSTNNNGIDFVLDQQLLHVISKVIQDSMKNTGWNLDFDHYDNLTQHIPIKASLH